MVAIKGYGVSVDITTKQIVQQEFDDVYVNDCGSIVHREDYIGYISSISFADGLQEVQNYIRQYRCQLSDLNVQLEAEKMEIEAKEREVDPIWCYEINIETLETESHESEDDGNGWNGSMDGDDLYEKPDYNEFAENSVYVETKVSELEAKRLVYEFCKTMADKFTVASARVRADMK